MISNLSFQNALRGCLGERIPQRVAVALSGGVDSMCLTYLLSQYKKEKRPDLEIFAVTIDHQYRSGSDTEAHEVGNIVGPWGVRHAIRTIEYHDRRACEIKNFEEVARHKRHELFEQFCREKDIQTLFLAHNLDDQLETFLQRLEQNSSLFGLLGLRTISSLPIAAKTPEEEQQKIRLARPLLNFYKSDIIDTCRKSLVRWFEDKTNENIFLTKRNLLRYIIQEEVPRRLSLQAVSTEEKLKLECLTKDALRSSYEEVAFYNRDADRLVDYLRHLLRERIILRYKNLLLSLAIPFDIFTGINEYAWSRFFYELLRQTSSVKHYHWSYAKIERNILPKIQMLYKTSTKNQLLESQKFTCLNLLWSVKVDPFSQNIYFDISRQPIITSDAIDLTSFHLVQKLYSPWFLFDRRYWLRIKSTNFPRSIVVTPFTYNNRTHRELLNSYLTLEKKSLTADPVGVPLIYAPIPYKPEFSLPTLSISSCDFIDVQWKCRDTCT